MDNNFTLRDHKPGDEIFQHDEGAWNITAIYEGIATEPETFATIDMPIDQTFIHYCKLNIGVNIKRARDLTLEQREDPGLIIVRERGESMNLLLLDGHHRAVRRWRDGLKFMSVHIISEQIGEMWRIKNTLILPADETSKGHKIQ